MECSYDELFWGLERRLPAERVLVDFRLRVAEVSADEARGAVTFAGSVAITEV